MSPKRFLANAQPPFKHSLASQSVSGAALQAKRPVVDADWTVLVVNSSQNMAKEITMQLTLQMPGCSIMYAPSIDIAKWILGRRKIDLVVSSPILPDGNIVRLKNTLEKMKSPPDVVVVGSMNLKNVQQFGEAGYEFLTVRRFAVKEPAEKPQESPIHSTIKELGADIRNDLNNPLQEIVAMVFVAQAGTGTGQATEQALQAINNAAKNMARVVSGLEERIREAVKPLVY